MVRIVVTLFVIAATLVAFRVLTPDTRRAIGDPVFSVEPPASASPETVASPSSGAL